ncbi:hypothetical protein [Photobacterium leiognathi]|uniref:hypothetical protein n=1 Tax=Photobacterium leiognathi TaxID=553611 RepID=UPI002980BB3E|nr:hypothetical protein [Photobacterium leiognathi]
MLYEKEIQKPSTFEDNHHFCENYDFLTRYLRENHPPKHIIDRFKRTLTGTHLNHLLYCEENDTLCGLTDLMFTKAICFGIPDQPTTMYEERFCFKDPLRALSELVRWHQRGFNDMRPKGWIACRNVSGSLLRKDFEQQEAHYARALLKFGKNDPDLTSHSDRIARELRLPKSEIEHLIAYLKYSNQLEF